MEPVMGAVSPGRGADGSGLPRDEGRRALDERLRQASAVAAWLAVTAGTLGLVGWLAPGSWREVLQGGAAHIAMSPNTALLVIVIGLAQAGLAHRVDSSVVRRLALAAAAAGLAVAALTLLDNLLGHSLRVDHWLYAPSGLACPRGNGHMSPITATVLAMLAAGVIAVLAGRRTLAARGALLAMPLGWLVITGYVADAPLFYGGVAVPVALLTGLGVFALGLALLAIVGTSEWPLRLLAGDSSRAVVLRQALPWLLLVLAGFDLAVGAAFRASGSARSVLFAALVLVATLVDLALMLWLSRVVGASLDRLRDEQRRLAERLRYRKKLEAIGTFAAGAAHEINNPLQQIMSSAEVIVAAEPGDPHIPIQARAILEATQRAAGVTHRLLAHATVDTSALVLVRPVDVLSQALALVVGSLKRSGITVVTSLPPDLPAFPCRRGPLSQALVAVLVNAREALDARYPQPDPDKRLEVSASRHEHDGSAWLRLVVADRGTGMPATIRERVFEPFFTTKTNEQGAGLGLWTAAAVVRELGGEIHVDSTHGEGTRVAFDLPVQQP